MIKNPPEHQLVDKFKTGEEDRKLADDSSPVETVGGATENTDVVETIGDTVETGQFGFSNPGEASDAESEELEVDAKAQAVFDREDQRNEDGSGH